MKKACLLLLLAVVALGASAQDDNEYRMEIGVGAGLDGYLGDFNGTPTRDLQPAATLLGKRIISPWAAVRLSVGWTKMKGSSADVPTYYPDYVEQPWTFSNNLYDLNMAFEYNFLPYGTGRDYRGAKRLVPFIYGGLGLLYVKAPDKGHAGFQMPFGLGVKYKVAERVNLGVEWGIHFTQSDWLDGVKDPYYIKSSGLFKNTDCYSALQISLTYCFCAKCTTCNKE